MFKIGDYIIYMKDVCKIIDIKSNYMNDTDYYVLEPVNDSSLKLNIPVNNKFIRNIITKNEVEKIISNIKNIEVLNLDDKKIEVEYKKLLNSGTHQDLIKIIKSAYLRNKKRIDNKKKISDKDRDYFNLAEKYLYTEFSIVLNLSFDETKEYVKHEVEKEV
jgi:CarD family transcriptional regulator